MSRSFTVPVTKPYKAVVAGVGGAITALGVMWATVELAASDDAISLEEISSISTAVLAFGATVYAVWRTLNPPVDPPRTEIV